MDIGDTLGEEETYSEDMQRQQQREEMKRLRFEVTVSM
jgi:hypothetical protein